MFGENVGVLQSSVIGVVELFEGLNAFLNRICGEEVRVACQPIHNIHLVLEIDLGRPQLLDPVGCVLVDEALDHKVEVIGFLNEGLHFLTGVGCPVDFGPQVSEGLLFVFDFNDFILYLPQLLI